ncbi:MAG: class I SAM-dependent methyltransferase [Nitrospiraceae bacterium]|nr:class I SAM-dependent methyltransferase [Nitrospiraceae bacterium]
MRKSSSTSNKRKSVKPTRLKTVQSGQRSCRFCGAGLEHTFADLGMSPLANSYIKSDMANRMEPFYPLHVFVCSACLLVQLEEFTSPQSIFGDYAYFSSFSESWLDHARRYVQDITARLSLDKRHRVVEIASNDGYLLQYFVERGVPVLGVEPAANVAKIARKKKIPTIVKFFGVKTARELAKAGKRADLLVGNNVLAHVPDINDFVSGLKIALKPKGVVTMEFPHLMRLMAENQFDTIYHEHFSYWSLLSVARVFAKHGLALFDVEEIPTHGGSLRIFACHADDRTKPIEKRLLDLRDREEKEGFGRLDHYLSFSKQVIETKMKLLKFLIEAKTQGKSVVGYGAPAKGNTLLNFCGVRTDFLDYTVDRSPYKQGHLLPGVRIPILPPEKIRETKPDYVLILPWNIQAEVVQQMAYIKEWGGKFVVPIPEVRVLS